MLPGIANMRRSAFGWLEVCRGRSLAPKLSFTGARTRRSGAAGASWARIFGVLVLRLLPAPRFYGPLWI
jgi:hypothetical protein